MKKRGVYIILLAALLLSSCVAYQSASVSINDAYNKGNVRVHTTSGEKLKFQNIEFQDSTFYGVTEDNRVKLEINKISAIHLEYMGPEADSQSTNSFMYIGPGGALGGLFLLMSLKEGSN